MYAVVVHGGAGRWRGAQVATAEEGVGRAAQAAANRLAADGSALDAVVAAVVAMEDDPIFNAGTGAVLNVDGEVEMDASVMLGEELRAGGVTCLKRVKNPVQVARMVMEASDHVLLAGEGALRFARAHGCADHDPMTRRARAQWERARRGNDAEPGRKDTVGAVALDTGGRLAAATSTGGLSFKLGGRVGDAPVPGAGNYANASGAASATGRGELMLRFATTKTVCEALARDEPAEVAVASVLTAMASQVGRDVGIVALDARGRMGVGHLTQAMPHAFATSTQPGAVTRIKAARAQG